MAYLFYVVVKLVCYVLWCWLGLRLWRPGDATVFHSARFGVLRLLIGIVFGFFIFFASGVSDDHLLWNYIKIYTPVRLREKTGPRRLVLVLRWDRCVLRR